MACVRFKRSSATHYLCIWPRLQKAGKWICAICETQGRKIWTVRYQGLVEGAYGTDSHHQTRQRAWIRLLEPLEDGWHARRCLQPASSSRRAPKWRICACLSPFRAPCWRPTRRETPRRAPGPPGMLCAPGCIFKSRVRSPQGALSSPSHRSDPFCISAGPCRPNE